MNSIIRLSLAALLFTACVPESNQQDHTVIFHANVDPGGLHAFNSSSNTRNHLFKYTQKTLTQTNIESLEAVPILVERLPSVDSTGKVYSFQLIKDAKWDDGTPFTSKDVLFTVKATLCPLADNAVFRSNYTSVIDSIVLDPENPSHAFKLYTKKRQWTDRKIFNEIYMQPAHLWDSTGVLEQVTFKQLQDTSWVPSEELKSYFEGFNDASKAFEPKYMYGLGAYKVSKWEKDRFIILERKENYWGEDKESLAFQNHPKRIVFKIIQEAEAVKLALLNQEIDVSTSISSEHMEELLKDTSFTNNYYHAYTDQFSFTYLALNMRPKESQTQIFKEKAVRKAFAHVVPMDEIINDILKGQASRMISNEFPNKPIFNQSLKVIPFKLSKATELLDQAGWVDTDQDGIREKTIEGQELELSFKLVYMDAPSIKEITLMIANEAEKVGFQVETEGLQFRDYVSAVLGQNFDVALGSWGGSGEYQNPYQLWHTDSWKNNGINFVGFGNDYTDSLIQAANSAITEEAFQEAYDQFQAAVYEEQPYVFLYTFKRKIAVSKKFNQPKFYAERPGVLLNTLTLAEGAKQTSVFDSIP